MNLKQFNNYILHLSLIPKIGPNTIKNILEKCNLENIYDLTIKDLTALGFPENIASSITKGLEDKFFLDQELEILDKSDVQLVTILDADYPESLRQISCTPAILYCLGDKSLLKNNNGLAVVGARKATEYGKRFIENVIRPLSHHKLIISGGALGIDSWANQAALIEKQPTVAVLGSGFKKIYPAQNSRLFQEIASQGGLMLTTFAMLADPLPGNFPARNSIVAGLCESCVVVQAAKKSGALITAYAALEQGKNIFAVPGCFDDELSVGCHELLSAGARLATKITDFIHKEAIGIQNTINFDSNIDSSENNIENNIIKICSKPRNIEYIANKLGRSIKLIEDELFELQLEGKIRQDHAGLWHSS